VDPRLAEPLGVGDPLEHGRRAGAARSHHADSRQRRQAPDRRRHRHVLEQGLPHRGVAEVLGPDRLAREAVLAHQARGRRGIRRLLRADEALDDARQALGASTAHDPLEQPLVVPADRELRVAGAHIRAGVGEPQHVAVRHALALAVLHRLEGDVAHRLVRVPAGDATAQPAAPAAEALHELDELEQVGRRPRHPRQRVERRAPRLVVAEPGGHRECEHGRVVLRRAARLAHGRDLGDRARAVLVHAVLEDGRVLARELPLLRVEAPALAAEDQEPAQPGPGVDLPDEAASAAQRLVAPEGRGLRRLAPQELP
jgi:hypothetical protein